MPNMRGNPAPEVEFGAAVAPLSLERLTLAPMAMCLTKSKQRGAVGEVTRLLSRIIRRPDAVDYIVDWVQAQPITVVVDGIACTVLGQSPPLQSLPWTLW
jgi:hypothetical protein